MSQAKYNTLQDLVTAIKTKELDVTDLSLIIDNDDCSMWSYDEDDSSQDICYFKCHPFQLLEDALDLLGVPFCNAGSL